MSKQPKQKPLKQSNDGPGQYNPDRSDSVTKCRVPSALIRPGDKRPQSLAKKKDYIAEAGSYAVEPKFGSNTKTFTMSKTPIDSPVKPSKGPGDYDVDKAVSATKPRTKEVKFDPLPAAYQ
jgi:hypothetical protein